jgi:hypothetical protein
MALARLLSACYQCDNGTGREGMRPASGASRRTRPGHERRGSADTRSGLLFDRGAALRAHHIKPGNLYGTACDLNQVTDEFPALCAEAAAETTAIVYEFIHWTPT